MTWQDASTQCHSLGARLAILDTPEKLDLIFNEHAGLIFLIWGWPTTFLGGQKVVGSNIEPYGENCRLYCKLL